MEKSILIDSFLLRKNEYFGYFRSHLIKVFKKNVNSESKDVAALRDIFTKFILMQLFWRYE